MRTLRSLRSAARVLALLVGGVWISDCSDLPTDVQRTKEVVRAIVPKSSEALAVRAARVLDAGAYHTCAIKSDSTVVCWGSNGYGESSVPAGLSSVSQIAAGGYHNCALKSDGTVTCWGLNHLGQGSVPAGLSSVINISAGSFHNCALKADSTVVCWGANGDGESNVPAGLSQVASISAGGAHTCAVKMDGTAVCWGRNTYGQTAIPAGLSPILQISTGADHTCALQTDHLDCWGNNDFGQGQAVAVNPRAVVQISAGAWHNCLVTTDGLLRCWGQNDFGQRQAPPIDPFVSVAAGTSHSCAAMADGSVMCWGDDTYGQSSVPASLTLAESPQQIVFTSVPQNPGTVGQTYTVAATGGSSGNPIVFASATAEVCGMQDSITVSLLAVGKCTITANQAGGSGYSAATEVEQSFEVVQPLPIPALTPQLSAGDALECALKSDGSVVCWGENAIQPPSGSRFVQISSGGLHSCGLKSDGTIVCWGENNFGQSDIPSSLNGIVQVAAGYNHTCALRRVGTVTCWGQNTLQQLNVPSGLAGVTQISTSASHTCARTTVGTIVCWGDNSKGQATVPSDLTSDRVVAGGYHTCAILNGSAQCWGSNDYSQLNFFTAKGISTFELGYNFTCRLNNGAVDCWGDNSRGQTTVPQLNDSISGISAGGYHACAFDTNGLVTCWGALAGTVPAGLNLLGNQTQAINFTSSAPNPAFIGGTYSPSATGGASGNQVVFTSLTPSVCAVTNGAVALTAPGSCTIAANQAGAPGFLPAPQVTQTFNVVPALERIASVDAGNLHSCALGSGGAITCWGAPDGGRLVPPSGLSNVVQLSVGSNYSCVLSSNATVSCWGVNGFGEAVPPLGLSGVIEVSAGGKMTCALKFDKSVQCWGEDTDGQLNPPSGMTALHVSAGGDAFGCALKTDHTVACWGFSGDGRTTVPAGLANVEQVSAGGQHACAVTSNGTVACWGPNAFGQTSVPAGLANVRQVSAGGAHTCALQSDGTVVCWGANADGQATPPSTLSSVQQISSGSRHTCARRTDGKIICWGWNTWGQTSVPAELAPIPQSIAFTSTPPSPAIVGGSYQPAATGGPSGNSVTFSSLTTSTCSVSGSLVSFSALGACTIAADQAGGNGYDPAQQVVQTFQVTSPFNLLSQCGHAITGIAFDGTDYFVGEGHDGFDQCISRYSQSGVLLDTKHFQVDMRGLHFVPALGLLTSRTWAGQLYSMNYAAGTQQALTGFVAALGVDQSQPAVDPDGVFFWVLDVPGHTAQRRRVSDNALVAWLNVTGGLSTAPAIAVSSSLVYVPDSSTVRAYDKNTGDLVNTISLPSSTAGCNGYGFGASAAGDRIMYSSACNTAQVELITPPGTQVIVFTSTAPSPALVDSTYVVAATGGASGNAIVFFAGPASVCEVSGNRVRMIGTGTCSVVAHQAGGNNYLPALDQSQSFTVSKASQAIVFTSNPATPTYGGAYTISATGGASGNAVVFGSSTPGVCTVSGTTATFVGAGSCTITANQTGSSSFEQAPEVTQTFTVAKAAQDIAFTSLPVTPAILGGSYAPSATSSAGTPITFSATGGCVLQGSIVSYAAVGNCIVGAAAAGNANYLPATITVSFGVIYQFTGFASPVSNPPTVNSATAGSVIKLKFGLAGNQGLDVIAAGYPVSGLLTSPCSSGGTPASWVPAVASADLKFDPQLNQYIYSWQTDGAWAGTCRQFALRLKDETMHLATFQFAQATKSSAMLTVTPSTVFAGVTTDFVFDLNIVAVAPIQSITGLPCQLPAIPENSLSYSGSCTLAQNKFSTPGKANYTAQVTMQGQSGSFASNTATIYVSSAPAPVIQLSVSPSSLAVNSTQLVSLELTISSFTAITSIGATGLVGLTGPCAFSASAAGSTSYHGFCTVPVNYQKAGKYNYSVPVTVEGRSIVTSSNTVTITVTK